MVVILNSGFSSPQPLSLLSAATLLSQKNKIDHCLVYHCSFTLVDMMMPFPFRNWYKKTSTVICSWGRHRVSAGILSMDEPPKCADQLPWGTNRSALRNSHGNWVCSRTTEGVALAGLILPIFCKSMLPYSTLIFVEGFFTHVCVERGAVKLPAGVSQLLD